MIIGDSISLLNQIGSGSYGSAFFGFDKNTKKLYVTSIKNLDVRYLVSNGNNLPFQCKWSFLNETLDHSTDNQAKDVLNVFYNSWLKKISIDLHPLERLINRL